LGEDEIEVKPNPVEFCWCGDRSRPHINHRKTIPCWTYIGKVRHMEWLDNQTRTAALEAEWQRWYSVHHVEVAHLVDASVAERDDFRAKVNNSKI